MEDRVINLSDFTFKNTLGGFEFGDEIRQATGVDNVVGKITILIPDTVHSIQPSFLEGMFNNMITIYRYDLMNRVKFVGKYNVERSMTEAISRSLRKKEF